MADKPEMFAPNREGGFGDGRFNKTMQNVVGPTLVAMATKFGLGVESSRLPTLSGCLSVNTITPEPLEISSPNYQGIILESKGMPSSKMVFMGCASGSDVLFCYAGAAWRMTVKELSRTIMECCAGGDKKSLRYSIIL